MINDSSTKDRKVSDIDIFKLLNFVLFACLSLGRQATFVVKIILSRSVAA